MCVSYINTDKACLISKTIEEDQNSGNKKNCEKNRLLEIRKWLVSL